MLVTRLPRIATDTPEPGAALAFLRAMNTTAPATAADSLAERCAR